MAYFQGKLFFSCAMFGNRGALKEKRVKEVYISLTL
jgi:hypothetical protein